jgi:DNA polymerase-3 subunit delta
MPVVDSQKIYKDLEIKKFAPVYFFYGDEPYLLGQIPDRFKFSVLDENTIDFNLNVFYGGTSDVLTIKEAIETLPVMTAYRLVILKNAEDIKEAGWAEMESIFKNPVLSTVFVICADKVDKRKKSIKLIFDTAVTAEFKKPYENQIPQWINHLAQNNELKFSIDATHRLHRLVGNNLSELENQILKLKSYIGSKTVVELKDINEVVSNSKEESVFDFTRAIGQKDRVSALEQLVQLIDQGQNEVGIVSLLARHMRILLTVRSGLDQGYGGAKLASIAQVPAYFIEGYCDQARVWSVPKIQDALVVLNETDKALKSSPVSSHIWLENMVLKSCSL